MSNFRIWWQASQWLPVAAFVVFGISCAVAAFSKDGRSHIQDNLILFAGLTVAMCGAVFNLMLNTYSIKVERLVLILPELRSLRTRKTIGWAAVALRAVGVGVPVALGVTYAQADHDWTFPMAMGFVAAAMNAIAMGFSLYKLFVSDRSDEKRRDVAAQGQQFGGWPANQPQQYAPLPQNQPYGLPPQQNYGQPPQQNYGWQPQQQASMGFPPPYHGGGSQQPYGGVQQPVFEYSQVQQQQQFQQSSQQQQAGFPQTPAYATQTQGHGQY